MFASFKDKLAGIRRGFENIPPQYRRWTAFGVLVAFLIALPITIVAFNTGNFELRKRAATGEVTPTPPAAPGCYQACSSVPCDPNRANCSPEQGTCPSGMVCGTRPCPAGQGCIQDMICYNPSCPFDTSCLCLTPTPTPTPSSCVPTGGQCLREKNCTAKKGSSRGKLDCKASYICCQLPSPNR